MPEESRAASRVLSLAVLLTLTLGLAAIYYFFGREDPLQPGQAARLRRPSSELTASPPLNPGQIIDPSDVVVTLPPRKPPPANRLPPDFPARLDASKEVVKNGALGTNPQLAHLHAQDGDPARDLPIIFGVLQRYLARFKAYPAGDNRQVTNALTGNNPDSAPFLPREHPAINKDGELTDRWGTPLFFHMIASDQIEIRSAGPDRQMYSADDLKEASPSLKNPEPGSTVRL